MKLLYRIVFRFSIILALFSALWAYLFFLGIVDEVNHKADDILEDHAEVIIRKTRSDRKLPEIDTISYDRYDMREVSEAYAANNPSTCYTDSIRYNLAQGKTEPVRVLTSIFKDDDNRYYELIIALPTFEKQDLVESIFIWILGLYLALLVSIILISIVVTYSTMRPLIKLLNWLESYKHGADNKPLKNNTKISEFRKLNNAAIRFIHRSEELFEQQRQFIGNASHEIQTPIAICQNRIEALIEEGSLNEYEQTEIIKTYQTLESISKLNQSLLLLSKIDNGQFSDRDFIEFNPLLNKYIADFSEVFSYKLTTIQLKETNIFKMQISKTLAEILVSNLLKNCFTHTESEGKIEVTIEEKRIVFSNSGNNTPLDATRIFERFYQGTKKEYSTGLGLAIAKSICRLEGLNLRYYYTNARHCFEISTPGK